ncbi:uncharacterized protein PADG_01874 [Paracoccidioides brasiliensis Pb18]|uniref:Uncharacterized protein n=1 Tax=Paracoccidioides brasiliensis (strain Pb18) TaxID=502780 RepID=C1G4K8_PARBD|nr:uncharacterized protein PADG_01874 [Paracoccidioides brasiliensis Pb18]EEH45724.2 hypothetical protein PADG_01874 [Paracoccidioides brasiliensis Pb18]
MMYVDAGNDIDFRHNWLRLKRSSPIQAQPEFDGLRNGKYVIPGSGKVYVCQRNDMLDWGFQTQLAGAEGKRSTIEDVTHDA